jgi:hypothetical protein
MGATGLATRDILAGDAWTSRSDTEPCLVVAGGYELSSEPAGEGVALHSPSWGQPVFASQ